MVAAALEGCTPVTIIGHLQHVRRPDGGLRAVVWACLLPIPWPQTLTRFDFQVEWGCTLIKTPSTSQHVLALVVMRGWRSSRYTGGLLRYQLWPGKGACSIPRICLSGGWQGTQRRSSEMLEGLDGVVFAGVA